MCLRRIRAGLGLFLLIAIFPISAQESGRTVWLEDLTWIELKTKIDSGFNAVILPTGGLEQNGPYITLGKHNHVVAYAAQEVAVELGHTLVAPVLRVVPQGAMDKPSGNLLFPGTMSLRDETFERVLKDMVLSLAYAGFKRVYLLGDHGQSQPIQAQVAQSMSHLLQGAGVSVWHVQTYYQPDLEIEFLARQGIAPKLQGEHAGVSDTAQIWAIHPAALRQRALALRVVEHSVAQGASGWPELASPELGRGVLTLRINAAVNEIRQGQVPGSGHKN